MRTLEDVLRKNRQDGREYGAKIRKVEGRPDMPEVPAPLWESGLSEEAAAEFERNKAERLRRWVICEMWRLGLTGPAHLAKSNQYAISLTEFLNDAGKRRKS